MPTGPSLSALNASLPLAKNAERVCQFIFEPVGTTKNKPLACELILSLLECSSEIADSERITFRSTILPRRLWAPGSHRRSEEGGND